MSPVVAQIRERVADALRDYCETEGLPYEAVLLDYRKLADIAIKALLQAMVEET
jgi:hypothetical protein